MPSTLEVTMGEVSPITRTTFWRGKYASDPGLRQEFFVACGLERNGHGS